LLLKLTDMYKILIITRVKKQCTNHVRNMGLHLEANVPGVHLSGKIKIYSPAKSLHKFFTLPSSRSWILSVN